MSRLKKSIALYDEAELEAWENAKEAAENELDGNPREGEVLRELCRAYTGFGGGEA